MSDALKWGAHSRDDRVKICLHDLTKYFADAEVDIQDQFIEAFDTLWSNEFCGGDAMFLPGQFSRFYEIAKRPEGNIHFAGEHLSRHHTWIAGALDSALTAVRQIVDSDVPALGIDHTSSQIRIGVPPKLEEVKPKVDKFDISSFACRFTIPLHLNVQYVEVM